MTKAMKKEKAQDLIMENLGRICYEDEYEEYIKAIGDRGEAEKILMEQMNRVAKIMGYKEAWFA